MTTPEAQPGEGGDEFEDDSVEIVATTEAPEDVSNETSSTLASIPFKGENLLPISNSNRD